MIPACYQTAHNSHTCHCVEYVEHQQGLWLHGAQGVLAFQIVIIFNKISLQPGLRADTAPKFIFDIMSRNGLNWSWHSGFFYNKIALWKKCNI